MVRGLKLLLLGSLAAGLAACTPPIPTPTPLPTNTPSPPPPTPVIVTIDASSREVPPTWTSVPTEPPAATSTRRPTSTRTAVPVVTNTPNVFTGQLNVVSSDGVVTVALSRADLESELAAERMEALFSSIVSSPPKIVFASRGLRLEVIMNNYTTEGLRSEIDFTLRSAGRRVRADITSHRTERGSLLTPTQVSAVRDMFNNVLDRMLTAQLTQAAVAFENPQIVSVSIEESRVVVTVRLKLLPTPTAGELPTEAPTEVPTDAPLTEPTEEPTATVEETATEPATIAPTSTLFPTATAP